MTEPLIISIEMSGKDLETILNGDAVKYPVGKLAETLPLEIHISMKKD